MAEFEASDRGAAQRREWLGLVLLVVTYGVMHRGAPYVFFDALPESFFLVPFMAVSWVREPVLLLLMIVFALPLRHLRADRFGWDGLASGASLRLLAGTCSLLLAWAFATQDPNAYLGQVFAIDRLALLALAILVWTHPAWVPLFVFQAMLWLSQFAHPLGMVYTPTVEMRLPLDVLWIFAAFSTLRAVTPKRFDPASHGVTLWLITLSVIASSYVFPGLEKLRISPHLHEWVSANDLSWLLVEASRRGWGLGLTPESFEWIRSSLSTLSPLLLSGSLALELGAVALLFGRRPALLVLPALALFHLFTALVSGFLFWKWALVNLAAFVALWRLDAETAQSLATTKSRFVGVLLLLLSFFFLQPNRLGWFERPYTYHFRFELIGASGAHYSTDPSVFAPFDVTFSYDRFHFLVEHKALRGQKDFAAIQALRAGGPGGVEDSRARYGRALYRPKTTAKLDRLLRRYFSTLNHELLARPWWSALQPPPFQIRWVNRDPLPYNGQESVTVVRVRLIEEFFEGAEAIPLRDSWIHEVEIPAGASESR